MIEGTTALRGLDVVFYTVKDLPRARAFYETLFGLRSSVESDYWVEYDLPDGTTFALANDPQGWKEGHGLMLGVTDRDAVAGTRQAARRDDHRSPVRRRVMRRVRVHRSGRKLRLLPPAQVTLAAHENKEGAGAAPSLMMA